MSSQREAQGSRFGRRRLGPVQKLTFFDRHFRSIHYTVVVLGVSTFFGPFIYRYFNRPSLEDVRFPFGQHTPNYKLIEKELDKWR